MKKRAKSYKLAIAAEQNVKEKEYWLNKLSGNLVKAGFPYDNHHLYKNRDDSHPAMQVKTFCFPQKLYNETMKLSQGVDVKLHMVLVAGVFILLNKYSARSDIIICSPLLKQEIQHEFINTILLFRNEVKQHMSFRDLLLQVRETIIQANVNQNYPMEKLIEQLNVPKQGNEFPLADVMVLLENIYDKQFIRDIHYNLGFSFLRIDESIEGTLEYNPLLYRERTVTQIIHHYIYVLEQVLNEMNLPLSHIQLMAEEERKQVLFDFNKVNVDYPKNHPLHRLFAEQAERTANGIAILGPGVTGDPAPDKLHLTYNELEQKSNQLAQLLMSKGVKTDTIVGIMADPSIELMVSILAILKAEGAYLPIPPNYPNERIGYMLTDSGAEVLVTTRDLSKEITFEKEIIYLSDAINPVPTHSPPPPPSFLASSTYQVGSTNLAYVIYTSGTTGKPKGVMVEHVNVIAYLHAFFREFEVKPEDTVIQLASFAFDVFVEEVFPLLLKGGKVLIPTHFELMDIDLLFHLIINHDVSIIDCTPLLLNELNRLISSESRDYFSHCRLTVISGGDVLKKEYVDNFIKIGKVYNTYGPTETTVCATYYRCRAEDPQLNASPSVPIGSPIANYNVYILDQNHHAVPIGVIGELSVSGLGVSRGYLNRPELTRDKFIRAVIGHSSLAISSSSKFYSNYQWPMANDRSSHYPNTPLPHSSHSPIYQTGDLARWLPDSNIEFFGRKDQQVKIRGYRIETGEIENRLLKMKEIKESVVIAKQDNQGDKYLCAYIVFDSSSHEPSVSELRQNLSTDLPEYMIPAYFVFIEKIPLTPNGKPDFKALPEPQFNVQQKYVAPRNEVEETLVRIWSEVLQLEKEVISIDANFFELGGHSLKATTVISRIFKELNVKISLTEVFKTPYIRGLAEYIKEEVRERYLSIESVEKKDYYVVSSAQKRLYILHQMDPENTAYNMPAAVPLDMEPDGERMEWTLIQLINRHESLRTSLHMMGNEPVQRVRDEVVFKIEYHDLAVRNTWIRPFDLAKAPLLRVGLLKPGGGTYFFMVDIHHIISDGVSIDLLVRDFMALYKGEKLPGLRLQYKDYARWQNTIIRKGKMKQQENYWLKEFHGNIPILTLPVDYERPLLPTPEGRRLELLIDKPGTSSLKHLAAEEGVSLYLVLLALNYTWLSKISSQEDIVIGTPIAGRRHWDLQQIIGMFVNILALRNYPAYHKTFKEFLKEVKKRTLEAFDNQDYQFEDLVEKVSDKRDTSHHPLFDVMFNFLHIDVNQDKRTNHTLVEREAGLEPGRPGSENMAVKFDLSIRGFEKEGQLIIYIDYRTKLFKEETIKRWLTYYNEILSSILSNPRVKLGEIEIIPDKKREQLLDRFNVELEED